MFMEGVEKGWIPTPVWVVRDEKSQKNKKKNDNNMNS